VSMDTLGVAAITGYLVEGGEFLVIVPAELQDIQEAFRSSVIFSERCMLSWPNGEGGGFLNRRLGVRISPRAPKYAGSPGGQSGLITQVGRFNSFSRTHLADEPRIGQPLS
jgi:hypothetical protein